MGPECKQKKRNVGWYFCSCVAKGRYREEIIVSAQWYCRRQRFRLQLFNIVVCMLIHPWCHDDWLTDWLSLTTSKALRERERETTFVNGILVRQVQVDHELKSNHDDSKKGEEDEEDNKIIELICYFGDNDVNKKERTMMACKIDVVVYKTRIPIYIRTNKQQALSYHFFYGEWYVLYSP